MKFDPKSRYEEILMSADESIQSDMNTPLFKNIYYGEYRGTFFDCKYTNATIGKGKKELTTSTYADVYTEVPNNGFEFFIDAKLEEAPDLYKFVVATTVTNKFGLFILLQVLGAPRPYLLLDKAAEEFFGSSLSLIYRRPNSKRDRGIKFELHKFQDIKLKFQIIFEKFLSQKNLFFSDPGLCLMYELYKRYQRDPNALTKQEKIYAEYSNNLDFLLGELLSVCADKSGTLLLFLAQAKDLIQIEKYPQTCTLLRATKELLELKDTSVFIKKIFQLNSEALYREFYYGDETVGTILEFKNNSALELGLAFLESAYQILVRSPQNTCNGKFFPVVSFKGGAILKRIDLLNSQAVMSHLFWQYTSQHTYFLDEVISQHDYPIPIIEIVEQFEYYFDNSVSTQELIDQRDKLFEEACSLQSGYIPPNAFVMLEVGPFSGVHVIERKEEIVFKWVRFDGGVYISYLNKLTAGVGVESTCLHFGVNEFAAKRIKDEASANTQLELWQLIDSNLLLISVCIVRDFWVYEERERVYSEVDCAKLPKNLRKNTPNSVRTVYLPRKRYSRKVATIAAGEALDINSRARHLVAQHFRKAVPSLKQRYLAQCMNVDLPDGYTLVKSHFRGDTGAQTIYKSKSALLALCESYNKSIVNYNHKNTWFQFEQDVKKLHEQNGYTILYQATSGIGDGGIDTLAQRINGADVETLIIQCKKWKQVIGPGVVRELIGSIEDFKSTQAIDAQGVLYTTSYFSKEAIELAHRHNIVLHSGEKWAIDHYN